VSSVERNIYVAMELLHAETSRLIKLGNEMAFQLTHGDDDEAKEAASYAWREATGTLPEESYDG